MNNGFRFFHSGFARWLSVGMAGVALFSFPSKTEKFVTRVFSKGLTIQAGRKDPPRIAFSEVLSASQQSLNHEDAPGINLNQKIEEKFSFRPNQWVRNKRVTLRAMVFSHAEVIAQRESKAWVEALPERLKQRVLAADEKDKTLERDWKTPSWRELLEEQLAQAKAKLQAESVQDSKVQISSTLEDGTVVTRNSIHTADVQLTNPAETNGINISGKVLLENGLYLGDGYIEIRRFQNRVPQTAGKINPAKGIYTISVPDHNGSVVASLYNGKGEKFGEGTLRLSEVSPTRFGSTDIHLTPVKNNVAVHFTDFSSDVAGRSAKDHYGDRGLPAHALIASLDLDQNADASGVVQVPNVIKGSWTVVRSGLEKYQPSLHLVRAGEETPAPLFKKSFTEALLSIAKDFKKMSLTAETNSIVWGQARLEGKPVSGIKVEPEFQDGYQVMYFNSMMLPDPQLTATGENGYYAIVHLPEGMHAIVATRGDQYFSHLNVLAEPESISVANLDATIRVEPTELHVFDAFSAEPLAAKVELQSLAEELTVNGVAQIYLPQIERLSLLRSEPQDPEYLPTNGVYTDTQDSVHCPLIRRDWIQQLKAQRKITEDVGAGVVIGFVQDDTYDVYLSHLPDFPKDNIVYFNSQGQITDSGVAGGGFILFNVNPGTQSVVVVSKTSNMANSQVIPIDAATLTTLQFHF